jgi:N-acetylglucosamine-6-sulfatase
MLQHLRLTLAVALRPFEGVRATPGAQHRSGGTARHCWRYLVCTLLFMGAAGPASAQMNVLVVMSDDQRFDTTANMPHLAELAAQGVRFVNSYAPTPLCGPARAGMYSGGFLTQNTNVLGNSAPGGGAKVFNDKVNLGTVMQSAGYRTYFVGKWVNGYEGQGRYIPPGWSKFVGRHSYATTTDWSSFRYTLGSSDQLSSLGSIVNSQQYTTYYERDKILEFLGSQPGSQPFFIFWSPSAPHARATPAPEDTNLFSQYTYRGRGYGETDLRDKPSWVRTNNNEQGSDDLVRRQLRSLQSVDRSFAAVVDKIRSLGKLDNTLIVYTSDNGYLWGEHGLWAKNKAYEESALLPFVVLMPGVAPRVDTHFVSPILDLGATLYELAGVSRKTDGRSLVPLLRNPSAAWRTEFFLENYASSADGNAIWGGLRSGRWKYVKYWTGEEELYDLVNDPYELESRHADPGLAAMKTGFSSRVDQQVGLAILPVRAFPTGNVGTTYSFKFKTWGGVGPFKWTLNSGALPPGITLDPATGTLKGVPTNAGTFQFAVRITDSVLAVQAGKPRTFVTRVMKLSVIP